MLAQGLFWLKHFLGKYMGQEEAQGLVEYALILVLVSIVVIVLLSALGVSVGNIFADITTKLNARPATTP